MAVGRLSRWSIWHLIFLYGVSPWGLTEDLNCDSDIVREIGNRAKEAVG